jgi:serine/threonine-protein kinase
MSQSSAPPSIRPGGLVAGKYRVDAMLGEGGMGTVWAATHVELGQRVALKLISSELARSADLLARFRAEAKAAAQLSSRYVVRMYDSGVTEDGRPYIAMEFLNGESLEDRLARVGSLPLGATVRIVSQVCKALKLAHAQGIIHRDLKPANIYLAMTGDDEEVAKVLDFGIAKMLDHERDHGATATGIILGTPLYMSPEQARALKTLDHRSDLYSLGMVTYRMLVGDPPFQGESFGDLVFSICTKPLPSMHEQVPSLPPSLDAWFQTACAKDPNARFNTAEQMNEALWAASGLSASHFGQIDTGGHSLPQGFGGNIPITSPSAGIAPVDSGAHTALVSSAVAAPSRGTAATVAGNTAGAAASTTAGTALPPSKPKSGALWPLALAAGVVVLGGVGAFALWFGAGASNGAGTPPRDGVAPLVSAQAAVTRANEGQTPPAKSIATEPPASAPPSTEDTAPVVSVAPLAASARPSSESTASGQPSAQAPRSHVTKKPPSGVRSPPPSKQPERTEKPPPKPGKSATPDMGF